jgi:uncharacterized protein YhfF
MSSLCLRACSVRGANVVRHGGYPRSLPLELGYPRTELRRTLVAAVLRGERTATAGLRADYAPHTHDPLPEVGEHRLLLGFDDESAAIVEINEVRVLPTRDIDLAVDEGEGFESVADWRRAHEQFWTEVEVTDETSIRG